MQVLLPAAAVVRKFAADATSEGGFQSVSPADTSGSYLRLVATHLLLLHHLLLLMLLHYLLLLLHHHHLLLGVHLAHHWCHLWHLLLHLWHLLQHLWHLLLHGRSRLRHH